MLSIRHLQSQPWYRGPGLEIRGIGINETMPPSFIERPAGTGDRLFMLFYDDVELGPANARRRVGGPSVALWPSAAAHHYGNIDRRWRHSWIHCDGNVVSRHLAGAGGDRERIVRLRDPSPLENYLLAMYEEINGPHAPDFIVLRNLLENFIREAVRGERAPARRQTPEGLSRVKQHIDTHYEQRITLAALAEMANLSRGHLCTEFGRHFGASPMAYLIHRRLHAAAALLRGTDEAVGQIGRRVGYDDPFYFSKHFKACFGVAPSQLRNRSTNGVR
ncbi:MAG TPA: AraC family transcriptional regulator [Tepidisphaeraceae bacterium]|jgi:AraC-like DNA-binding protein|nr:AraC family transcriptional regulator [Tepidisphaeraceae bacterium]